jgi:hypothetical protein
LRPAGVVTNDVLYLENGRLITRNIHAVIDLEVSFYNWPWNARPSDVKTNQISITIRTTQPRCS